MPSDGGLRAVIVAGAAVTGYIITTLLLRSLGYPGHPEDGPAVTGAVIYGIVTLAIIWVVDRRRTRSTRGR
jgi:hypothetical protein